MNIITVMISAILYAIIETQHVRRWELIWMVPLCVTFCWNDIEHVDISDTYKITRGVEPLTDSRATRFRTRPPLYPRPGFLALSSFPSRYPVLLLTFHLSPVTLILWPKDNLPYRLAPLLRTVRLLSFNKLRNWVTFTLLLTLLYF